MVFDDGTLIRLLGSIEANRLVLLCGAGLSVPPPSSLMSAVRVSQFCYDKYAPIKVLPPNLRDDVDLLSGHFYRTGQFESVFLGHLVPWNELVGEPNSGHAAIADLLISGGVNAVLSANFDTMIEHWASEKKVALRGALNGQEALEFGDEIRPLVKFHGCLMRNPEQTLWTQAQLTEAEAAQRVESCSSWMKLNLPGKDLLVVGFWTDWGYLNDVLATAMETKPFASVTVIDPVNGASLQSKAPTLWARFTTPGIPFQHIQASGASALEELRAAYSRVWGKKFYGLARPLLEAEGRAFTSASASSLEAMECEVLYDVRRDAEGVPYNRAARRKEPAAEAAEAAFAHLLLIEAGATRHGAWYVLAGRTIRVVHGSGQAISTVREHYVEPPPLLQPDIVVCAGALDLGVPGRLISGGRGASVMRPGHGGGSRWLTLEQARDELKL